MTSAVLQTLPGHLTMSGCSTTCNIANHRPAVLGAFSALLPPSFGPATVWHSLQQSPTSYCGQCRRQSLRSEAQGSTHRCLVGASWSAGKDCHRSIIHKTKLMPVLVLGVKMEQVLLVSSCTTKEGSDRLRTAQINSSRPRPVRALRSNMRVPRSCHSQTQ